MIESYIKSYIYNEDDVAEIRNSVLNVATSPSKVLSYSLKIIFTLFAFYISKLGL